MPAVEISRSMLVNQGLSAQADLTRIGDPLHDDDRRLAHALIRALGEGHRCCRDSWTPCGRLPAR